MRLDRPSSGGSDRPHERPDRPQETGNIFGSRPWDAYRPPPMTAEERETERQKTRGELRQRGGEWVKCEPYDWAKREDRLDAMKKVELPAAIREFPKAQDAISIDRWNWTEVDVKKFNEYSMNPDHPQNRGKAKGFEAIGYNVRDKDARLEAAWDMRDVTRMILPHGHVTELKETPYGLKFRAVNGIIGPNGRAATYDSCWMVDERGDGIRTARMITSWVRPHKETAQEEHDDRA